MALRAKSTRALGGAHERADLGTARRSPGWTASRDKDGYGMIQIDGRKVRAHNWKEAA